MELNFQGPTIFADWGDNVVVHMTSNLKTSSNGSSFHFHGTHQNYTNPHDGVVAITQCPVAPGSSVTYRWRATQYGTSWYHSHFGLQTYDGVYGGLIIRGPASANYEEDVGTIMLSDWSHKTVNQLLHDVQREGPALMDNVLINGTNVYGNDTDKNETGERFRLDFEEGKTYRLRLINTGIDTLYKFSIDHHTLKVIAVDFVSVEPYETDHISLAIGTVLTTPHPVLSSNILQVNAWIFLSQQTKLQGHRHFGFALSLNLTAPETSTLKMRSVLYLMHRTALRQRRKDASTRIIAKTSLTRALYLSFLAMLDPPKWKSYSTPTALGTQTASSNGRSTAPP